MNPVIYNSTTLNFLPDSEFEEKEKRDTIQLDYIGSIIFYVTEPLINRDRTGWVSQHVGKNLSGGSYAKRVSMTPSQTEETRKQCPTEVCFETRDVHPLNQFYLTLHNNVYSNWHFDQGWKRVLI